MPRFRFTYEVEAASRDLAYQIAADNIGSFDVAMVPKRKWFEENAMCRPGAKKQNCCICRKPFVIVDKGKGWAGVPVMVCETRTSNFRGDDKVEFAHPECAGKEKS